MSDLLNSASLVLIPSGYKEDVVYSEIPTDGSGDLTFTRASDGTRINSAGLVEVVPWNLVQQSETFNVSPWGSSLSTISINATTAPNGTTTADKLVEDTNAGLHQVYEDIIASGSIVDQFYTLSCYAKASERSKITLILQTPSVSEATFDLINATASITGGGGTAGVAIENVGNGWYRCSIYRLNTSAGYIYGNIVLNNGSTTSYTGNGTSGAYIWGAQLNIGSTAKPYFPTTNRQDVPRLTYQNGGGGCPSLLLEKQSTNLVTYSEAFDNVAYTSANVAGSVTITSNYAISPDGTQNADRFQLSRGTSAGNYAQRYQVISATNNATYTFSCWIKSLSGTPTIGWAYNGSTWDVITLTTEWVRYTWTTTTSATPSVNFIIFADLPTTSTSADFLAWGYQIEQSNYPTSYIPTQGSSVTRLKDVAYKTGISSLIGGGTGTWFIDFDFIEGTGTSYPFAFDLSDGTSSNRLFLYWNEGVQSWVWGGTDTIISLPSTLRKKVAIKFSSGTAKLFCNGSSISTLSINSSFTRLDIGNRFTGNYPMDGKVNQAYFLTTSLTDAECISLTTL